MPKRRRSSSLSPLPAQPALKQMRESAVSDNFLRGYTKFRERQRIEIFRASRLYALNEPVSACRMVEEGVASLMGFRVGKRLRPRGALGWVEDAEGHCQSYETLPGCSDSGSEAGSKECAETSNLKLKAAQEIGIGVGRGRYPKRASRTGPYGHCRYR